MDTKIYLVQQLFIDSMENNPSDSSGYEPIGFVMEHEIQNQKLLKQYTGTGYPICKGKKIPVYKITELKRIKLNDD